VLAFRDPPEVASARRCADRSGAWDAVGDEGFEEITLLGVTAQRYARSVTLVAMRP
jgi:hypothetical protein